MQKITAKIVLIVVVIIILIYIGVFLFVEKQESNSSVIGKSNNNTLMINAGNKEGLSHDFIYTDKGCQLIDYTNLPYSIDIENHGATWEFILDTDAPCIEYGPYPLEKIMNELGFETIKSDLDARQSQSVNEDGDTVGQTTIILSD